MREATPDDLRALVALELACFDAPWPPSAVSAALDGGTGGAWISDSGDTYLLGTHVLDEFTIDRIATHPAARRTGRGRALLRDVLTTIRERGVCTVFLEVRASNVAARTLYDSHGFTVSRRRRDYYGPGEDGVDMRLDLTSWSAP